MAVDSKAKTKVVVAGGGTAGWLTAYSLVTRLGNLLDITLVGDHSYYAYFSSFGWY